MKPIRLFDQAPDSFIETPRTPPGAVDYPLPADRQRGLSSDDLPRFADLRDGGNMPDDAGLVTPFALIAIAFGLAGLLAVWLFA
jgi:hypothetical protein